MSSNGKYFSWGRVILVSLIVGCTELMWTLYNTYVPIWLQAGNPAFNMGDTVVIGFGMGAFITGVILTLDNIAGLFISPLIGMISDTTFTRFGRRKPWIMFAMPVMIISFILIPVFVNQIPAELNGQTDQLMPMLIPFIAVLVLMLLAYAVIRTPADVIMYDITPSKHRGMASSIANLIGASFGVAGAVVGAILFDLNPGLPFWVGAVLSSIVITLVAFRITEPRPEELSLDTPEKFSLKVTLNALKTLPQDSKRSLLFLYLSQFFSYFAFGQLGSFSSSYGVSVLGMSVADSGMLFAAGGAAFILGTIPTGFALKKISRKTSSLIGFTAFGVMGLVIYLFPNPAVVWPSLAIGGLLWALVWVPQSPMIMDAVPSDQVLGSLKGMEAISRMLGYILGPMAGGFAIEAFGNNYSNIWLIVLGGSILGALLLLPVTRGEVKTEETAV
jgi:maltose/moltooligosaccharide transporter